MRGEKSKPGIDRVLNYALTRTSFPILRDPCAPSGLTNRKTTLLPLNACDV